VSAGAATIEVVDYSAGLTLSPGAIDYVRDSDAMDLRAQVRGASAASYAWDLSGAPDATGVAGANGYDLRFGWSQVASGLYSQDQVQLTVVEADGTHAVSDYTFYLVHDPNYSADVGA
jgi:hypothetical protein